MARTLLVRGMLVGVIAGLAALVFALVFGEPQVAEAIRLEEAGAAPGEAAGPEPVSRAIQATIGLGIAVTVYGAAIGGVFGLAFGFVYRRFGRAGARPTALAVAVAGFVAVVLVPFLKYPGNPPGLEATLGMGERTSLYFLLLLIAVVAAIGAALSGHSLVPRWGAWNAVVAAVIGYAVVLGLICAILPNSPAHIEGYPADLLWRFRISSLGMQAVLWAALGLVFGALTQRSERRATTAGQPLEPVA
jgi:predicted cobalt transporter CbtA